MFNSSSNIKKLRELVDQLCIRDTDTFKRLDILKLTLGYSTDGYWDWDIEDDRKKVYENIANKNNSSLIDINESVNSVKKPVFTNIDCKGLFNFDLFFDSFTSSPELITHLGFESEELNTEFKSCMELANKDDLMLLNAQVNKHFESKGEHKFKSITRYKHKDGHTVKILSRGSVIEWDSDDNPVRMVGTHIDITNL